MKKEGRDLVSEAVNDAKSLKDAALSAAKNEIVESLAPALKSLLEKNIRSILQEDKPNDQNVGYIGKSMKDPAVKFQEGKEEGEQDMGKPENDELDLESIASFFPPMAEEPEEIDPAHMTSEDPAASSMGIPMLGEEEEEGGEKGEKHEEGEEGEEEVKEAKKADKEDEEMSEEIEISEAELRKVYEAALQTEVQVKKGFSDMTPNGELEDVVKDADKGLADVKKGEHAWEAETPPAKQDFTVKEVKELINKGLQENKALRENNSKLVALVKQLGGRLHEVNLFNAKVLHVNRILNKNGRLTAEQKKVVLESIDKAKTIDEVRMVYETITNSFAAMQLSESTARKPAANAQRARTSGAPDQEVLRESVDRQNGKSEYDRLMQLAGLCK